LSRAIERRIVGLLPRIEREAVMVATDTAATQTHWRIRGEYLENCNCDIGDVSLDGLNVGLIARTPGAMADGNWQVALYVDDRADDDQRGAVQAIFTGSAGGVMANLAPLIGEVLGVRSAAIHWRKDGKRRSIQVDDAMALAVHAAPSIDPDGEIWARNAHPFAPEGVAMAVGDVQSTFADYGMSWDNSGKNAHYAPIDWSN
jgi:hypothetical protein